VKFAAKRTFQNSGDAGSSFMNSGVGVAGDVVMANYKCAKVCKPSAHHAKSFVCPLKCGFVMPVLTRMSESINLVLVLIHDRNKNEKEISSNGHVHGDGGGGGDGVRRW
jgi:hypothetical protein